MKVLIDTDAFCKLGVAGLLEASLADLGCQVSDVGRLPALPHMLARGRLHDRFGAEASKELRSVASAIPAIGPAGAEWLDPLAPLAEVDPGEAQIFAKAAEEGLLVMTGDKRALKAVSQIDEFRDALSGRVVVLEATLISLCRAAGIEPVRVAVRPLETLDTMISVCFSADNSSPPDALASYFDSLSADIQPLKLWSPYPGG